MSTLLARYARLVRFAVVGFSGVFANLGALWLFADLLGIGDVLSSAMAIELSIVWNFALNNAWTFRDKNAEAQAGGLERLVRYNAVSLVGLAIQLGTFVGLRALALSTLHLAEIGLWKYPCQAAGIGVAMFWNFGSNFYWTWAQKSAPNPAVDERREDRRPAPDL